MLMVINYMVNGDYLFTGTAAPDGGRFRSLAAVISLDPSLIGEAAGEKLILIKPMTIPSAPNTLWECV